MRQKLNNFFTIKKYFQKVAFVLLVYLLSSTSLIFGQACDATFTTEEVCNTVTFTPNTGDNTLNFLWDFGDGNSSMEYDPSHVYIVPDPGTYDFTVTLIVSGSTCIQDTVSQEVFINVGDLSEPMLNTILDPPFTNCSASLQNPNYELLVQNATEPTDNLNYHIDWGDGTAPYDEPILDIASHTYTSIGLFDIVFTVTGNNQCIAQTTYEFFNGNTPGVGVSSNSSTVACIPATINFPYTLDVLENPVGTTYTLFVNDGSGDTTIIQHPPALDFYSHEFTSSPCDSNLNEYTVTMIAENACSDQTSTSTVKLDRGPEGSFEIDPDPACQGEVVMVTNTSEPGIYTVNGECSVDMSSFWTINPGVEGVDYTVIGNLGDYPFEPGDSAGFTVVFSTPGEYDITLSYGSATPSVCPRDTVVHSICILEAPIASMVNNTGNGCFPIEIDLENTSNTIGSCEPANYLWQVVQLSSDCGDTGDWTFVDPTSETSQDATILFESSGVFEVTLIAENICGIDTTSTMVEIGESPVATIMPIDTFCNEAEIFPEVETLSSCEGGMIEYDWNFPTGNPSGSTSPTPGPIIFNAPGPHTIFLTTTNDCGSHTTQETLHIYNDPDVPEISSNEPVCTGEEITLFFDNDPGGLTYQWTGPALFSSTLANPTIPNASEANEGIYTLVVTDTISDCTNQASLFVEVYDAQLVQIQPNDSSICIGESITLIATGANNYTWTGDYLNTTSGSTVMITPPDDLNPLPFLLVYTVDGGDSSNGCSAADTITLTINPPPSVSAGNPLSACVGVSIQLDGDPVNGNGGVGEWTGPFVTPGGIFNASAPGTYILTYTFTNDNSCQDSSTVEVCVLNAPVADFSVSETMGCEGLIVTTENFSGYEEGDCAGVSYFWDVNFIDAECHNDPGDWTFTTGNATSENPSFQFLQSGIYNIILNVYSPCDTTTFMQTIEIGEAPQLELMDVDDFCDSGDFTPAISSISSCNSPVTYAWEFPGADGVQTSDQTNPPVISYSNTGDYIVILTITNACGTASDTIEFSILEDLIAAFEIPDFVCLDPTSFSFVPINNSVGDQPEYDWMITGLGNPVIDNPAAPEPTITVFAPGEYIISLTTSNTVCGSSIDQDTIQVNGPPEVILDNIQDICVGGTIIPDVTYIPGLSFMDSIVWDFPGGISATGDPSNPGTIQYLTSGIYTVSVFVQNACGIDSTSQSFQVLEGPLAIAQLDTSFACIPGDFLLGLTNFSTGDNLTYSWSIDMPGIVSDTNAFEPVFTLPEVGWYTISLETGNGVCPPSFWMDSIFVSTVPSFTLGEVEDGCVGSPIQPMITYANESLIDSVIWSFPGATPESSTAFNPPVLTYGGATGTFTAYLTTYNACGITRDSVSFQLLEELNADAVLDTNFVCIPPDFELGVTNLSTGGNPIYSWTISAPGIVDDGSINEPVFTLSEVGWYDIMLEVNNGVCPPSFWTDSVFVSTLPEFTLSEIEDACAGSLITPEVEYANVNLVDSVFWEFPGAIPTSSTEFMAPVLDYGDSIDVFTIYLTTYNRCGIVRDSMSFELLEALNAEAQLDTAFACVPPDFELGVTNLSTGGNPTYDWQVSSPATVSDPMTFEPVFNFPDTGWFTITLTVTNNGICPPSLWQDSILIGTEPSVELLPVGDFCESVELFPLVNYSDTSRIDSVVWNFSGGVPTSSNIFYPGPISYAGAGDYSYEVTVYNACGSNTDQMTFTIDTIPEITFSPKDTICKEDGLYIIPEPIPPGGIWIGSPAIIAQNPGIFDPDFFPQGDTLVTILYEYTIGECIITVPKEIMIFDLSIVSAEPDINTCISEDTLILNNGMPGGGWYAGEGVTDTLAGVFEPAQTGIGTYSIIYYYQLPFTDCIGTDTFMVTVHPLPTPMIQGIDSLCVNTSETIFNGTLGINTYEWNIEDTTYVVESPTHIFQDTGLVDIQLIVTSEVGCVDSITTEVYISGPPIAAFEKDTTEGCATLPVVFTNNSIGFQHVNYDWDFGNQMTSNLENPDTILYEDGTIDTTYYITLIAENHCGLDIAEDSVLVFPRPQPFFLPSQFSGCTPVPVSFDNFTVGLPDSVWWDLGNGMGTSDFIPPDQVYVAEDTVNVIYTITLYAFNDCGIDSFSQEILVKPEEVRAFFSVAINEGCEPLAVDFNSSSSPDSAIVYNWYFGDFLTSNAEDTTVVFNTTGDTTTIYPVLLVVDNGCDVDSFGLDITVYPAPEASFTVVETDCVGDSILFTNTSLDVNGIFWDFGDGNTSTLTNPYHIYDEPGLYTVIMTAASVNNACPASASAEIEILENPIAAFDLDTLYGCPPLLVSFNNQSEGGNFHTWNFGDGNTTVGVNPAPHLYEESGLFDIMLTVTNIAGCTDDTIFSSVEIYPVPVADFTPLLSEQCGVPQEVCFENISQGATGFNWNLGNGDQTMENAPCTDYLNAGDYLIELTATNQYLCENIYSDTLTLYDIPIADFNPEDTTVCQFSEITFNNLSLNAESAVWVINGEEVDTSYELTLTFPDTGLYNIDLIVSNNSGCTDTLSGQTVRVNPRPIAEFIYDKLESALPTTYQFTDTSSSDAIYFWWDFDDGTILEARDPRHRFLSSFDKDVKHWVGNVYDCWDTTIQRINLDALSGLYVPNIMEPNLRDRPGRQYFIPTGIGLADFHIAIYARNGQLLWESTKLDEREGIPQEFWDGTFRGREMPTGAYVWKVHKARFFDGTTWEGMKDEDGKLRLNNFFYLVR